MQENSSSLRDCSENAGWILTACTNLGLVCSAVQAGEWEYVHMQHWPQ